jgi:2-polyprenyl-3-methyl-5-hydroxy-6-metoxy-1,4-benzoquinol methylase
MPILSRYARWKKIRYFLERIPKQDRILEIGCGSGWAAEYLRNHGWTNYTGIDLYPPADIVGDIRDWKELGMRAGAFDVILAFEVIEHVDCVKECYDLLKPGGRLLVTTPIPGADWFLKWLEAVGLNQKRTSPHEHLTDLRNVPCFEHKDVRRVGFLSQWAVLTKGVYG